MGRLGTGLHLVERPADRQHFPAIDFPFASLPNAVSVSNVVSVYKFLNFKFKF
jgi:hypothetical protein